MSDNTLLAFESSDLEGRFRRMINKPEMMAGLLFMSWSRPKGLHWKQCQTIFGVRSIGMISGWIVFPNKSKTPKTSYAFTDTNQVRDIWESNPRDTFGMAVPFFSHGNNRTSTASASQQELGCWIKHFSEYKRARGAIAHIDALGKVEMSYYVLKQASELWNVEDTGDFLPWRWINYKMKVWRLK